MSSGVYLILNTKNNNKYVGSSGNLSERGKQHFRRLDKQAHENPHLQRSWNKYSPSAFSFHVLALCARERKSLLTLEQHFIDLLRPEYNIAAVAGSALGLKHSAESRARMSAACKRRKYKPLSEEHKANISAAHKGKKKGPRSAEHRAKLSSAHMGKKHGPHSEETKAKISAANMGNKSSLGRKNTPEAIAKLSAFNKGNKYALGHKRTNAHKAKISKARKGKPWTPAQRAAYNKRKEEARDD